MTEHVITLLAWGAALVPMGILVFAIFISTLGPDPESDKEPKT